MAADGVARWYVGGFRYRERESRERPLDLDPFGLMDRRDGTHHRRRLKNSRGNYGKHRDSTHICEDTHKGGGQFLTPGMQGRVHGLVSGRLSLSSP
jgi:hypothetical protein